MDETKKTTHSTRWGWEKERMDGWVGEGGGRRRAGGGGVHGEEI